MSQGQANLQDYEQFNFSKSYIFHWARFWRRTLSPLTRTVAVTSVARLIASASWASEPVSIPEN
jgi:hypothetical protein